MGKMRREPDFVAGEMLQRKFIVEESRLSVLVEITVGAAPLVDLIRISVCIVELVSEQLIGYSCCPILPASSCLFTGQWPEVTRAKELLLILFNLAPFEVSKAPHFLVQVLCPTCLTNGVKFT